MEKIKSFIRTEAFKYLFFGVLTTVVYYIFKFASFFLLDHSGIAAGTISEVIGQTVSIVFAFFTNKIWVFEHKSTHAFLDFLSFAAGRVVFMLLSIAANWWFVDTKPSILMNLFHSSKAVMVLILTLTLQIITIILNYIYSKFIVFRKKKSSN